METMKIDLKAIEKFGERYVSVRDLVEYFRELQDKKDWYPDGKILITELIKAFKGAKEI